MRNGVEIARYSNTRPMMPTHSGMPYGSPQPSTLCCVISENNANKNATVNAAPMSAAMTTKRPPTARAGVPGDRCPPGRWPCAVARSCGGTADSSAAAGGATRAASGTAARTPQSFFLRG